MKRKQETTPQTVTIPFTSDQIDIKNERKSLTSVNLSKSQNSDQIEAV